MIPYVFYMVTNIAFLIYLTKGNEEKTDTMKYVIIGLAGATFLQWCY